MTASPSNLLSQIEDIKGLDPIGMWPPAPIWWILLAIIILVSTVFAVFYLRRRAFERSWKGDANRTLAALEARIGAGSMHELAGDVSAVLRRVAMQRFSRKSCAGLKGREWLLWLQKNDPRGFDWPTHGRSLTEIPYAPPHALPPENKIRALIDAIKPWVA